MARGGNRPVRTNTEAKPVSGPGKLSQRTDMAPQGAKYIPGGKYGEGKALMEQQMSAPMAGSATPKPTAPVLQSAPKGKLTGLFDPTTRPDEPVTAGLPIGPGRSPEPQLAGEYDMINKYLPALEAMASQKDAPPAFVALVNYVKVNGQKL